MSVVKEIPISNNKVYDIYLETVHNAQEELLATENLNHKILQGPLKDIFAYLFGIGEVQVLMKEGLAHTNYKFSIRKGLYSSEDAIKWMCDKLGLEYNFESMYGELLKLDFLNKLIHFPHQFDLITIELLFQVLFPFVY